jgi:hypothetical protein
MSKYKYIVEWYGSDWEYLEEVGDWIVLKEVESGKIANVTLEYFLRNIDEGA